jgi:hypothetical protein
MSIEQEMRQMIRAEVERLLQPMMVTMSRLGAAFGTGAPAAPAARRGAGRPAKALASGKRGPGRPKKSAAAAADGEARACAVLDCGRPARSKGFCAAHYQKFRMLARTGRLPSDWVEYAPPNSVTNVVLPRGRAGARALAEAKKKG